MKSIEEQTREAAENHYTEWNKYPSNGVKEDCMDDFIAGANWERNRDKWISVKDELPELNTRCLVIEHDGEPVICNYCKSFWNYPKGSVGFLDEQDEQPSMYYPTHWQPIPEPPKQKED